MDTQTLGGFLRGDPAASRGEAVSATIRAIASTAQQVRRRVRDARPGDATAGSGTNPDGDKQIGLDVFADQIFLDAARLAPVASYASEELSDPVLIDASAPLALAVDPLDGSSNVELDLSFGTIFSILPALPLNGQGALSSFLQPGSRQLAAGFVIYGPRLALVISLGDGTHVFSFSESAGDYVLIARSIQIPKQAAEFAINASNYRHWEEGIRLYFDDCVKGIHGPRERDFNMRWLASLVVEAYRILMRGGVFLYPADKRPGYSKGRLRLVYEANPVAFLMEQAGGSATDGAEPILSLVPTSLHQRTPLVFGSGREVAKLTGYHSDAAAIGERSPLFAHRGLFRP
jgi:fructose-1,6-bisphosphatase I